MLRAASEDVNQVKNRGLAPRTHPRGRHRRPAASASAFASAWWRRYLAATTPCWLSPRSSSIHARQPPMCRLRPMRMTWREMSTCPHHVVPHHGVGSSGECS